MFERTAKKLKNIEKLMAGASSYAEWCDAAAAHDRESEAFRWRQIDETQLYDYAQIRHRLDTLRLHRAKNDHYSLLYSLNEGIHGNMGGMGKSVLYNQAKLGTKRLIENYVDEIVDALNYIADLDDGTISKEEKLDFFHRASHCYGRTALMLSGGGALGPFHVGVVKALLEQDLLPNVISGSSAGSIITAIYGTRTDLELQELFTPVEMIAEAKKQATWLDNIIFGNRPRARIEEFEEAVLNRLVPDLTFQEAFEKTGRRINISVAPAELHQTSRLLNAITSPNVYIRRAVMASIAVPGVYPPVMLEAKNSRGEKQPYLPTRRWIDGSVSDDLPAKRLSRLYGVNHYIGSLINPIVMFSKDGWDETHIPPALRALSHRAAARIARTISSVSQKYTPNWTRFNLVSNMFASVLNQEYSADINVYPNFHKFDYRRILSHVTEEDFLELVRQGELSTWRKMEQIRTSSKISHTLDRILERYGEDEMLHVVRQKKQAEIASKIKKDNSRLN